MKDFIETRLIQEYIERRRSPPLECRIQKGPLRVPEFRIACGMPTYNGPKDKICCWPATASD